MVARKLVSYICPGVFFGAIWYSVLNSSHLTRSEIKMLETPFSRACVCHFGLSASVDVRKS
jgi:hypothetical protein